MQHVRGRVPVREGQPTKLHLMPGGSLGGEKGNGFQMHAIDGGLRDITQKAQHVEAIIGIRLFGLGIEERIFPIVRNLVDGERRPTPRQARQIEVMHEVTVLLSGKYTKDHVIAFWDGSRGRRGDGAAIRRVSLADDFEDARRHLITEALRY